MLQYLYFCTSKVSKLSTEYTSPPAPSRAPSPPPPPSSRPMKGAHEPPACLAQTLLGAGRCVGCSAPGPHGTKFTGTKNYGSKILSPRIETQGALMDGVPEWRVSVCACTSLRVRACLCQAFPCVTIACTGRLSQGTSGGGNVKRCGCGGTAACRDKPCGMCRARRGWRSPTLARRAFGNSQRKRGA